MNRKKRVTYYRIDLSLKSALSIGAADSVYTDNDVVRDSRGLPLIPGSSLAGVYRSYFNERDSEKIFGPLAKAGVDLKDSPVRVYDAVWTGDNKTVWVRDGVGLEQKNKVAKKGLKFDRQIVERGASFRTYIEITDSSISVAPNQTIEDAIEKMLGALSAGHLRLGGKTSRGLGVVTVDSCKKRTFDLAGKDLREWLDFCLFTDEAWSPPSGKRRPSDVVPVTLACKDDYGLEIVLQLEQRGAVSIREYSTEPGRPDFEQMHIRDTRVNSGTPIIPGTSWAGAFRSEYRELAGVDATRKLFGDVWHDDATEEGGRAKTRVRKSRIEFTETEIRGGHPKQITRNSIDRFTGGTKEHALFTLSTHYAGTVELSIRVSCKDDCWDKHAIEPLLVCIADLNNGLLPIGGLTAVGHGMFKIVGASCTVKGDPFMEGEFKEAFVSSDDYIAPDVIGLAESIAKIVGPAEEGDEA